MSTSVRVDEASGKVREAIAALEAAYEELLAAVNENLAGRQKYEQAVAATKGQKED